MTFSDIKSAASVCLIVEDSSGTYTTQPMRHDDVWIALATYTAGGMGKVVGMVPSIIPA